MFDLLKQDAQRWVVPGQFADPNQVSWGRLIKLLLRHMQMRMMFLIRFAAWCNRKHIRGLPSLIQRLVSMLYGLEISVAQEIGGGLYIPHPYGMVLMPNRIGNNCSIIHNVTLGMRNKWEFPTIEDDVFIGAGARVLGGIRIGRGSRIGANAVVIEDVPAGATVVGVPARIVRIDNPDLPESELIMPSELDLSDVVN